MVYKCNDCNVIFTTKYLLSKHEDKDVPCTMLLACIRCNKTFTNNKFYLSHINRKFPCKETDNIVENTDKVSILYNNQSNLELKKLEVQLEQIKFQQLQEKSKIKEIEKEKEQIKKASKKELKELETKKILEQETIKKEKALESKKLQMEINEKKNEDLKEYVELRKQVALELKDADIKNSKNVVINNNIVIYNNLLIMELENNFINVSKYNMNDLQMLIEKSVNRLNTMQIENLDYSDINLTNSEISRAERQITNRNNKEIKRQKKLRLMYDLSSDDDIFIEFIVNNIFNSPNRPNERFVYYNKTSDSFYGIVIVENNKTIELLDFNKSLASYLNKGIAEFYNYMWSFLGKYIDEKDITKDSKEPKYAEKFQRYELIKLIKDKVYDNDKLREYACKVFDIDYTNFDKKKIVKNNVNTKRALKEHKTDYEIVFDTDSGSDTEFYN